MPRIAWTEVDADLRAEVERLLGAAVVRADSQPGGFSPGSADRVLLADGRRAFVKTATDAVNADVVGIHRAEAAVAALLPPGVPSPRFRGVYDDGRRIAVAFEDVEARHPDTPWRGDELTAVLDALVALTAEAVPAGPALADLAEAAAHYADGWSTLTAAGTALPTLADDIDPEIDGWIATHVAELLAAADRMPQATRGDRLVHRDLRQDNILLRADGSAVFVDWPWAARGAGWIDALTLLFNVRYFDPAADVEAVVAAHPVFDGMAAGEADAVLAGLSGHFLRVSLEPEPPGITGLRAFQRDQAVAILRWLRERWDAP